MCMGCDRSLIINVMQSSTGDDLQAQSLSRIVTSLEALMGLSVTVDDVLVAKGEAGGKILHRKTEKSKVDIRNIF